MTPQPPYVLIDDARLPNDGRLGARLFANPSRVITCTRPEDAPAALAEIDQALADGHHVAGYLAYELGYVLEPKLVPLLPQPLDGPLIWMGVFDAPEPLLADVFDSWAQHPHGIGPMRMDLSREDYIEQVERIREHIRAGDVYQINHTFKQRFDFCGDPLALYAHLRHKQRARYGAVIATGERHILSLSPELFVESHANLMRTRPMKGTAARAATLQDDEARKHWLCHDEKSKAENLMIVDLLRNDLGRIALVGSVNVTDLFSVETYPTLHQMTSGIEAKMRPGTRFSHVIDALFPCGSVTGAPKVKAMEIIRTLESEPRGVYTGAVGYASPQGLRFNVAIRTIEINRDQGQMGIGSGIVYDSDPVQEWHECHLKAQFVTAPHQPFDLLETLSWHPSEGFALLDRHMARLAASAAYFGYPFDEAAVRAALHRAIPDDAQAPLRARLLVDAAGKIAVETVPLAAMERLRFVVSDRRIDRDNRFVYHKTTNRAFYDDERARQQALTGCDEVLFLNDAGELTEGSFTNLFVELDGRLLTPSASCGLLAGTLRQELLDSGRAVEAVLKRDDLKRAERIFLGNSVRGLIVAQPL
ncbi:aminodeoxychorismate synthase component I [Magnetovibrio sp.]|uniref:aminodeoxychorismate synthase component I n=1 Tax=Magnetovibrio sp. TaxID=2024836 RepID=UPI002F944E66